METSGISNASSSGLFTDLDPLGTGKSKPYVDKKDFFSELKSTSPKLGSMSNNDSRESPVNFGSMEVGVTHQQQQCQRGPSAPVFAVCMIARSGRCFGTMVLCTDSLSACSRLAPALLCLVREPGGGAEMAACEGAGGAGGSARNSDDALLGKWTHALCKLPVHHLARWSHIQGVYHALVVHVIPNTP